MEALITQQMIVSQILFLSLLCLCKITIVASSPACPLVLTYVSTFKWNTSSCQDLPALSNNSTSNCCQMLQSIYGLALARRLRDTKLFLLPDIDTSVSCLQDFQSNLNLMDLPEHVVSSCFVPTQFVITNNSCAGIESTKDWVNRVGQSTELDSACGTDLANVSACDSCVSAGFKIQAQLIGNNTNNGSSVPQQCFFLVVLYAAGISNYYGPLNYGVITCILSFPLHISSDGSGAEAPLSNTNHSSNLVPILVGVVVSVVFLSICLFLALYVRFGRAWRKITGLGLHLTEPVPSRLKLKPLTGSIWFQIKDLERATNHFSRHNLIGQGGSGVVYKGILSDGTEVAVKKITGSDFEGDTEFCNEVEIVSNLRHRNLVTLLGCCCVIKEYSNKQWYLVYDYMVNGSLADYLFSTDENKGLTWTQRKNIILDVAKGLDYLHNGVKPAIFHRDIKATNILIDWDMSAKLADFGLAKQNPEGQSLVFTRVAGTYGYVAPEYALYGQLSLKTDVYSFGIVILEIMSGRRALDASTWIGSPGIHSIADWASVMVKAGEVKEVLDDSLMKDEESINHNVMERFMRIGVLCTNVTPALRPTAADALKMLNGDVQVPSIQNIVITPSSRHPMYF